ncbi:hypothetical protein LPJ64_003405 [Coemansia asiatica]|uniref:Uncharacterized protein n=1 Tax=Coemansia asiatica TaxID=1052880 RepID=A0A9W8CK32_9FUNG|nr:hypothetical protein LPJ64_003405 [Coemansia asiatica]
MFKLNIGLHNRLARIVVSLILLATTGVVLSTWYSKTCQPEIDTPIYHRKNNKSLAVIMPMNCKTDVRFYKNMWIGDYLHPVCDWKGPGCAIYCNQTSTYNSLAKKTICFTRVLKKYYTDTEFFIKLDDDALIDRDYIFELVEKYRGFKKPLYISEFSTYRNNQPLLNGTRYGNGKFYMFNRKLLDCIATGVRYQGNRNEDAIFGALVRYGCGDNVKMVWEDNSRLWHKNYFGGNKFINLAALSNH